MPVATKLYTGKDRVPFHELTHTQKYEYYDTLDFTSPYRLETGTDIHMVGEHQPFGGRITKREETPEGYSYNAIDYSILLNGKGVFTYTFRSPTYIIHDLLKDTGVRDSGVTYTNFRIPKMFFKDVSRFNACQQLANAMNWEFYITPDRVAMFQMKTPPVEDALIFPPGCSILDRNITDDTTQFIDKVNVYGKDDKLFAVVPNDNNNPYIQWYGIQEESIRDTTIINEAMGRARAAKRLEESLNQRFGGSITVPPLQELRPRLYCFVPKLYEKGYSKYYVNEVSLRVGGDDYSQTLSLMNGPPPLPNDWEYNPSDNSTTQITCNTRNVVCGRFSGSCGHCVSGNAPKVTRCWVNECPECGHKGSLIYSINLKRVSGGWLSQCPKGTKMYGSTEDNPISEGHVFCCYCDTDFCGYCGRNHLTRSRLKPSTVDCTAVTKEDVSKITISGIGQLASLEQIGAMEAQFEDCQREVCGDEMSWGFSNKRNGKSDCWGDSIWLYNKFSAAGIPVRIVGNTRKHRWVEINMGSGWINFVGYIGCGRKWGGHHYGPSGTIAGIFVNYKPGYQIPVKINPTNFLGHASSSYTK